MKGLWGYQMKRVIIVFAILIATAILVGALIIHFVLPKIFQNFAKIDFSKPVMYQSGPGEYKILLSKTWMVNENLQGGQENSDIVTVITGLPYHFYIDVNIKTFADPTVEAVDAWDSEKLQKASEFTLLSNTHLALGMQEGIIKEYTFGRPYLPFDSLNHCYDWITIHQNEGYIFTLCSDDSAWRDAQPHFFDIIKSIQFIDQ
jgi:hypothetical protein